VRHGLGVSKDSLTGSCDDGASLLEKLALGLQREENAMTGRKRGTHVGESGPQLMGRTVRISHEE
jgi:hypothetical protein